MKIISKDQAAHVVKPEGVEVWYYLFDEYEVHYNEQQPHTSQVWHYHEHILETIFIISGEMTAFWKEDDETKSRVLKVGDLVETENSDHTFKNESESLVKFLVIKQVLAGENKRETLKSDKIVTG